MFERIYVTILFVFAILGTIGFLMAVSVPLKKSEDWAFLMFSSYTFCALMVLGYGAYMVVNLWSGN